MRLSFILSQLDEVVDQRGPLDLDVNGVVCDSREVKPGRLFVALPGTREDGRRYVEAAVAAGAVAVVAQDPVDTGDAGVAAIQVASAGRALGRIADVLHAKPSHTLKVAGVTGTNGKTTTCYLIHHLMTRAWHRAGLIGTVVYDDGETRHPAARTTPAAHELHRMLAQMRDNACLGVAMEVSSHGLMQQRVAGVRFDVGVFTNLTRDHLDYHGTMEDYYRAKEHLALILAGQRASGGKDGLLAVNSDDVHGQRLARDFAGRVRLTTFGFGARSDMRALRVEAGLRGTSFAMAAKGREFLVKTPLIGRFNVYNALAALAAADGLDLNFREAVQHLADAPQVPGRMERVVDREECRVFVDYAHSPDALENALRTLRELRPARLITVFGCGGDRDREKRPMMGRAASQLSDICVITSDNPRGERPLAILREIEAGITGRNYRIVEDRREAIQLAVRLAGPGDVVLLAGKGHEDYQEILGAKHPFDDRVEARRAADAKSAAAEGGAA
jgi:UDP-N-acetylmuramoyl-L-alanyl-D-glutamate--2,6-diaminopimelate ligase